MYTIVRRIAFIIALTMAAALSAPAAPSHKILVAYYSNTGNTRAVANHIHELVGGDLYEIKLATPYPDDYDALASQAKREIEAGFKPTLNCKVADFASYDLVFIGSPVWYGTLPPPVSSFLASYDFSGKTIVPFCTYFASRQGKTISAIKELCPRAKMLDGIAVLGSDAKNSRSDVAAWLRRDGLIDSTSK